MTHPFTTKNAQIKRGNPAATVIDRLRITPLWPVTSGDLIVQLDINSPREAKQCYHAPDDASLSLPDVRNGDVMTVSSVDYIVIAVAEWPDIDGGIASLHIVCEELKANG